MSGEFERAECDYEPSFKELLPVLGDSHAQEEIRNAKPGKHCPALEADPYACKGCKLDANPFKDNLEDILLYLNNKQLAEDAYELYMHWRLGGVEINDLTSKEYVALCAAFRVNEDIKLKALGLTIGNMIATAFGGGGKAEPKERL